MPVFLSSFNDPNAPTAAFERAIHGGRPQRAVSYRELVTSHYLPVTDDDEVNSSNFLYFKNLSLNFVMASNSYDPN